MKKYIEFKLRVNNPSEQGLGEILEKIDSCVEDLEHLQPIAEVEIKYIKE